MLPKDAIKNNIAHSAEYLSEKAGVYQLYENIPASVIDHYADGIILSILWNLDAMKPLESVMRASYSFEEGKWPAESLLSDIEDGGMASRQYIRYWHGSVAITAIMLLALDIRGIYVFHGLALIVLAVCLICQLIKKRFLIALCGITLALISAGIWLVPLSLEYTWNFLLMLGLSLVVILAKASFIKKRQVLLFFFAGIVTNYLDFLTTESITLTIPLLLLLYRQHREGEIGKKELALRSFLSCLFWGIGYAGMWATKWLLAALALGENVLPYISGHIDERLGTAGGQAGLDLAMAAIWENFRSLFPMGWQPWGWTVFWIAAFLLSYLIYVYRRKRADWSFIAVCSVLGLLPYVRYAVLQDHSYTHFFFTYRAQASGVLALSLILSELVDWEAFLRGFRRKSGIGGRE